MVAAASEVSFSPPPAFGFLYADAHLKAAPGGRSSGKALRDDTPIATPDGWKNIGFLRVGDVVFGAEGNPVTVTGVYPQGKREEWRMEFQHSIHPVYCDADHLWATADELYRKRVNRRGGGYKFDELTVRTTKEIAASLVKRKRDDLNHRIPVAYPIDLPEKEYLIPPYTLGVWLGDGASSNSSLYVSPADIDHFRAMFSAYGETISPPSPSTKDDPAPRCTITPAKHSRDTNHSFRSRLRKLGLLDNKHIPDEYLRGSIDQRFQLLSGLMDTDGTIAGNSSSSVFRVTNRCLAVGFYELAASLGFKPSWRERPAKLYEKICGTEYSVEFFATDRCFTLDRKLKRVKPMATHRNRVKARSITSCAPTGSMSDMTCISVDDPNQLFLAGRSMVPTHNTTQIAQYIILECVRARKKWLAGRQERAKVGDTVKMAIEEEVENMGLESHFHKGQGGRWPRDKLYAKNGSIIVWYGFGERGSSMRGYNKFDGAWVDEAQELELQTLVDMQQTIRKAGSQMIFSWNRQSFKDPVDDLFFAGLRREDDHPGFPDDMDPEWTKKVAPANSIIRFTTFRDNPYIMEKDDATAVLIRQKIEDLKSKDYNAYLNEYEGRPVINLEALVFPKFFTDDLDGRITEDSVPYLGADWGQGSAPSCLSECYIFDDEGDDNKILYIANEAYRKGCTIDDHPALFYGTDDRDPKRWGNPHNHPGIESVRRGYKIVADTSGLDKVQHLKARGFNIMPATKGPNSLPLGIEFLKTFRIYVHPKRCPHTIDELSKYQYKTDKRTGEVLRVLKDKDNHLIDSIRYAVERVRRAKRVHVSYGIPGMGY